MKVLVTGAGGFIGRNLCETLKTIRDGEDRRDWVAPLLPLEVMECDVDTSPSELDDMAAEADFVYNLAGVNRPEDPADFMAGNFGFASDLLEVLKKHHNTCPVVLASSIQATLMGRYQGSVYGESKLAGEELFRKYSSETGAPVLIYRFPNVYGKWCRPNYNSVVATFCYKIARDEPIIINDPATELELLYIDDLVQELVGALLGNEHRCSYQGAEPVAGEDFCYCPVTDMATLGEIASLLRSFAEQPKTLMMPEIALESFASKLYSTYLSYVPIEDACVPLASHEDERGSFTEVLHTPALGQFSVNVSKPGVTKGMHWHHSKWEIFVVVSGQALVRERRIGSSEAHEFTVSGDRLQAVYMLPGYTHEITNLSSSEDLVTLIWANENFDPGAPDTFFEGV